MYPEFEDQLTLIQLHTRKAVNELLAGEYRSVFRGRGIEFDEVREYQHGDDVRMIDWNVTARTGRPHIKRYIEERELSMYLLIDVSGSLHFGSIEKAKRDAAAELASLLAFSAIENHDKVGLIMFTTEVELFIPPAKGRSHVLHIIDRILRFTPKHGGTNIDEALSFFDNLSKRRSIVFLLSDFQATGYQHTLEVLAHHHDMIAVSVSDRHEAEIPDVGLIKLRDAETGKVRVVDTSSHRLRESYRQACADHRAELHALFAGMEIDYLPIYTHDDYVQDLVSFFQMRKQRVAHGV